jgi:hypothetical protein
MPVGQKFYTALVALAKVIRDCRADSSPSSVGRAFTAARTFVKNFRFTISYLCIANYDIFYKPEILRDLQKSSDPLQALDEMIFGFHGIKNQLHTELRLYLARQQKGEKDYFKDSNIVSMWGDVELAVEMLSRI